MRRPSAVDVEFATPAAEAVYPKGLSSNQPRVARNELPWESIRKCFTTLKGLHQSDHGRTRQTKGCNPFRVDQSSP
jgi:hypothetical protein